jgi:nucleotide-binding universal stress UspA family protein
MKKILIPVDFSSHTDMTLTYALEMAKVEGAEILLFHTCFDQIVMTDTSFPDTLDMSTIYNEELMKEISRQAEKNLTELCEKVKRQIAHQHLEQVSITSVGVIGEIEHELKLICKEYQPDFVVMGTRGKGNNLNVWGKVSTYVIDHANVPVFTIPRISSFRGFRNIMFATDLGDGNVHAIRKISDIFKAFDHFIHVVHFLIPTKKKDEKDRMDALKKSFHKEESLGVMSFDLIKMKEVNQAMLDQFIQDRNIDIIAFQPHKRGLLYMIFTRKITKKNLFATNIPLLAIPADK